MLRPYNAFDGDNWSKLNALNNRHGRDYRLICRTVSKSTSKRRRCRTPKIQHVINLIQPLRIVREKLEEVDDFTIGESKIYSINYMLLMFSISVAYFT